MSGVVFVAYVAVFTVSLFPYQHRFVYLPNYRCRFICHCSSWFPDSNYYFFLFFLVRSFLVLSFPLPLPLCLSLSFLGVQFFFAGDFLFMLGYVLVLLLLDALLEFRLLVLLNELPLPFLGVFDMPILSFSVVFGILNFVLSNLTYSKVDKSTIKTTKMKKKHCRDVLWRLLTDRPEASLRHLVEIDWRK